MFFLFKFTLKKVLKNCFSAFGKILVLANVFSIQILVRKVLKNCFFSFWQDLGSGECIFSIKILIKQVLKI